MVDFVLAGEGDLLNNVLEYGRGGVSSLGVEMIGCGRSEIMPWSNCARVLVMS